MRTTTRLATAVAAATIAALGLAGPAAATPVCTDGYKMGPPLATCGNRIFPEAAVARAYVQFLADATGFREYADGIAYLAQKYPRWVSVGTLRERYKDDRAVSVGNDDIRSFEDGDTKDGHDLFYIKLTDHQVPDAGKNTLFFSLSVHGNERGGLEGGLRTAEDIAMAAENGGEIVDGIANYETNTGREPEFHSYPVSEVLAKQAVYLMSFNPDGWAVGDTPGPTHPTTLPYSRGNGLGTDLNRQMPTVGRINASRNPLFESEMNYGTRFMDEVAAAGINGKLAYGADIHGELTSRAYIDIMYPAGEFDSVKHRQLMAIAERTKSVVDATLFAGIQNQIEEQTGGNEGEGLEDTLPIPGNTIPTMPAHWATVWDTLGYTDTGFIGDYLAADLGVTGMDYEIFLNHTVPDKVWNVYLQENHINGSRAIIKTAMAYALYQSEEFNENNVKIVTGGQAGYVVNPDPVTDKDKDGVGSKAGPDGDNVGANGKKIVQVPYRVTNQKWFTDTSRLMPKPFLGVHPGDIAASPKFLDRLDTLVLADITLPRDAKGRKVDAKKYWANIRDWVNRGGNLVLTDKGLHALELTGLLPADSVSDFQVYQPYSDITDFESTMVRGLRRNARQLVEAAVLGYGIGDSASPMSGVDPAAWGDLGGSAIGTTTPTGGAQAVTIGEASVGKGLVRILGGALPTPTEDEDHRYGLRNYALTYSGLYIMENAIVYDAAGLGAAVKGAVPPPMTTPPAKPPRRLPTTGTESSVAALATLLVAALAARRRVRRHAA